MGVTQVDPESEQAPVETPEAPEITFEEPEAPAEEQQQEEIDPVAALQAKIAELEQRLQTQPRPEEIEERLAQRLRGQEEQERQERQAREREQADREELNESIQAVLISNGYHEVEPEQVRKVAERYVNKRYDQIANRTAGEVRDALMWIREVAEAGRPNRQLQGRAQAYADQLTESFGVIFNRLKEQAAASGDYIPKSELPKLLKAELARRNAEEGSKQRQLRSPTGQGAPARSEAELLADPTTPIETIMEIRRRQRGA